MAHAYSGPCGDNQRHPHGAQGDVKVETKHLTGGYLLANGVSRTEADKLRESNPGSVASRNADGTYRVTQAR